MTFNYRQLREGDYVLVSSEAPFKDPVAAKVIHRDSDGGVEIEFSDGRSHYFDSKSGYDRILAGTRPVEGGFQAL
jgi:hypothetical protein